jgi:hypothetical protein
MHVIAEESNHAFQLPRVSIPRWSRSAEQVQMEIENQWGLRTIILDCLGGCSGRDDVVVAEVISEDRLDACQERLSWTNFNNVSEDEVTDLDRSTLQRLLATGATGRGPFSRLGWTGELLDWVSAELAIDRSQFPGEMRQLNASATHSLIRIGRKTASSLWFKAVGEPNHREFQFTTLLSRLFPAHLPRLIAIRTDWNGWLMEDAGQPLEEADSVRELDLREVGSSLAELQLASIERTDVLIANGIDDQRMPMLRGRTTDLIPYLAEAMEAQSFDSVPRLDMKRLRELETILHDACFRLEELRVPYALVHNDINLANVLVSDGKCAYTDWARPAVSNPFVTLEQLKTQLAQDERTAPWIPRITDAYRNRWRAVVFDQTIDQALALIPLVALATQLWSHQEWVFSEQRNNPGIQSYIRSLVRQMDRAARSRTMFRALSA